jgi:hypothetical protein
LKIVGGLFDNALSTAMEFGFTDDEINTLFEESLKRVVAEPK